MIQDAGQTWPSTSENLSIRSENEISWTVANAVTAFQFDQFKLNKNLALPHRQRFFITPLHHSDSKPGLKLNATLRSGTIQLPAGTCLLSVRFAHESNTRFFIRLELLSAPDQQIIDMYESDQPHLQLTEVRIKIDRLFQPFRLHFVAEVQNSVRQEQHLFLTQAVFAGMELLNT